MMIWRVLRAMPLALALLCGLCGPGAAQVAPSHDPSLQAADCVIPAKAGGGFALTCELARDALQAVRPLRPPLNQRYMPGGIGAVAFDRIATGELGGPGTLVAFSSGSLLNLAQGRFGPHPPSVVKWVAVLGTDYGVIAVHKDSPYKRLQDLVAALRQSPSRVVFEWGALARLPDELSTLGARRALVLSTPEQRPLSLSVRASGQHRGQP